MKTSRIQDLLDKNKFFSLAIDQGTSLKNLIKENKKDFRENDYFYFKKQVILNLSSEVSSILFDYDTFQSDEIYHKLNVPKIIAYEDDAYNIDDIDKITNLPKKNIDQHIDKFSAIKFFMYFNPDSMAEINNKKIDLILNVSAICKKFNVPFLFEPLLYYDSNSGLSHEEFCKKKPQYIKYFYSEFSKQEYFIDIIKIEFPFNEDEVKGFESNNNKNFYSNNDCQNILQDVFYDSKVPFVFLSAGMKFNNFYNSLSLAKSSGIDFTGFLCGRSIWYDAINIFSCDSNEKFINWILNEGKSRLVKLKSTL